MSNVRHYYNDVDPVACEWTRELIRDGLIPGGDVDCRSICEVQADEIRGYTQWHFFVGISGWPLALRLAGVDPRRSLLTGSAPCQPFSSAGKRKGEDDERHLWPELLRLISELRPPVALGEQVASRLGREWLARVRTDLEGLGYAVGASDLPAGGCGAPHKRQRLFWGAALRGRGTEPVADVPGEGCRRRAGGTGGRDSDEHERLCHAEPVADAGSNGLDLEQGEFGGEEGARERSGEPANDGGTVAVAEPMHSQRRAQRDADGGGARGGDATPGVGAEGGAKPVGRTVGAGREGCGASVRGGPDDRARGGSPAVAGDPQSVGNSDGERCAERSQRDGEPLERGQPAPSVADAVRSGGGAEPVEDAAGQREGAVGRVPCGQGAEPDGGWNTSEPVDDTTGDGTDHGRQTKPQGHGANHGVPGTAGVGNHWSDYDVILCGDGKHRRIPKGSAQLCVQSLASGLPDPVVGGGLPCRHAYPLAPAYPGRVALLKGIGNAISPHVGAVFVRAFFEAVEDQNG